MSKPRAGTVAVDRSSSPQSPYSARSPSQSARSPSPVSSTPGDGDQRSSGRSTHDSPRGLRQPKQSAHLTVEEESELRQFLKVARPDWSMAKKHGHSDVNRVVEKLKAIGVLDTMELMRRVQSNTINEDFTHAGKSRFSKDTMEAIRKQSSFVRALEHLKEPFVRQVGPFAPVPQLLSGTNLRIKAGKQEKAEREKTENSAGARPSTDQGGSRSQGALGRSLSGLNKASSSRPMTVDGSVGLGDLGGTLDLGSSFGRLAGLQASVCSSGGGSLSLDECDGESWGHPRALYLRGARPRHRLQKLDQTPGILYSLPDLSKLPDDGQSQMVRVGITGASVASRSGQHGQRGTAETSPANTPLSPLSPSGARPHSPDDNSVGTSGVHARCESPARDTPSCSSSPSKQLRRTSNASTFASTGKDRVAFKHDYTSEMELEEQVEKWNKEGQIMSKEPREARWASRCYDVEAALHQGEAMLEEQAALDDRKALQRMMVNEGPQSPLRRYVVNNIQKLLEAEKDRDTQGVLDTQQRAINIRKQLTHMQSKRRDLAMLNARVKEAVFGKDVEERKAVLGLSAEKFHRTKTRHTLVGAP